MTIVNDSHLAYLLSLGFDIELCKQALTQNSTLENATEWILNSNRPPVLDLGLDLSVPYSSSGQLAPTPCHDPIKEKQQNEESKRTQKKKFEQINNELRKEKQMEREARQRALLEIKEDQEKRKAIKGQHTISSTTNNSTTAQSTSSTELSERQRIQLAIKKEKRLDMEQRQRVLQSIRDDQKDKRMKKSAVADTPTNTSSSSSTSVFTSTATKDQDAFIQFKLTDASTIRQKFPASAKVKELLEFVLNKELASHSDLTVDDLSLVCGFPRRTFTIKDQSLNMREAGFLPNVSLNVVVPLPAPAPVEEEPIVEEEMEEGDEEEDEEEDEEDEEDVDSEFDDMMMDIDNHPEIDPHRPPLINRRRRAWGPVTSGGYHLTDPSPVVNTSEIVDTVMEEGEAENAEADRRTHMLSAIEQRSNNNKSSTTNNNTRFGKQRLTKTLKDFSLISVAGLLTQHTISANRYLKNLVYVSSDVAESLLTYLMKNGKLNALTLKKLADHCYLQNIVFDSYTYCTDSLIEDLCKSNSSISITKLSLRGCDVITDGAIRSIEGLKNLNYLDLNNCKVTDKGLKSLEKLQYLSYLNLSKTKVTNAGIFSMVSNAKFKNHLEVLLLDGCTRVNSTGILIPIVNEFINLVQLSFAYTTPGAQLEQQQTLTNKNIRLEQLDINHTFITDQDLITTISQFKSLVELKLGGCEQLTTRSLSFLPRDLKNLKYIQFPNREHELDGVLSRYKDLPIEHMNLTGYLNVTDEGAKHIASMKHLRYLSLDGTKVTDEGIMLFQNLIELEKLYLDRTLLTDVGLEKLTGLSKLETLSLCRTEVSNVGLCLLGDFEQTSFARNLRTLNLAQCTLITDKGVRGLAGMANLTNLNLDHTSVSKACIKYLKDLEHLNLVRLQGIEKEQDDTIDLE